MRGAQSLCSCKAACLLTCSLEVNSDLTNSIEHSGTLSQNKLQLLISIHGRRRDQPEFRSESECNHGSPLHNSLQKCRKLFAHVSPPGCFLATKLEETWHPEEFVGFLSKLGEKRRIAQRAPLPRTEGLSGTLPMPRRRLAVRSRLRVEALGADGVDLILAAAA